jgi:hypothetical protein
VVELLEDLLTIVLFCLKGQYETSNRKLVQDLMELQLKHTNLNEQLSKVFKENAEMIMLLKEKEQVG